jgi:hypothetical protein
MLSLKLHFMPHSVTIHVIGYHKKFYSVGSGVALTTHSNISSRLGMSRAIPLSPLCACMSRFYSVGSLGSASLYFWEEVQIAKIPCFTQSSDEDITILKT